jgi:hypothetical protein
MVLQIDSPFQVGCYVLSFHRRSDDELLLQEWRVEITSVGLPPDLHRALFGGAGSFYCTEAVRSHPLPSLCAAAA